MVARVMPGVTVDYVLWEMPFALLSFFVMQERRDAGVKGIGRRETRDALWRAFQEQIKNRK